MRYLKCEWPDDGQSVAVVGSFLATMKLLEIDLFTGATTAENDPTKKFLVSQK